jgi:hypothetical protein
LRALGPEAQYFLSHFSDLALKDLCSMGPCASAPKHEVFSPISSDLRTQSISAAWSLCVPGAPKHGIFLLFLWVSHVICTGPSTVYFLLFWLPRRKDLAARSLCVLAP